MQNFWNRIFVIHYVLCYIFPNVLARIHVYMFHVHLYYSVRQVREFFSQK